MTKSIKDFCTILLGGADKYSIHSIKEENRNKSIPALNRFLILLVAQFHVLSHAYFTAFCLPETKSLHLFHSQSDNGKRLYTSTPESLSSTTYQTRLRHPMPVNKTSRSALSRHS